MTDLPPISTKRLFDIGVRRLGKRPTEAARYGRFLVESRQWRPGQGGWSAPGQVITTVDEAAAYLLALMASETALGCGEVAALYRDLVDRETGRTLGQAVGELINRARTPEGRWELRNVRLWVARRRPTAQLVEGDRVAVFGLPRGRAATDQQREAEASGLDLEIAAIIGEETIKDFGAALGAPETRDAPQAEAGGASQVSGHPRANGGKLVPDREQDSRAREISQPRRPGRSPRRKSLIPADDGEHDGDDPPRATAA